MKTAPASPTRSLPRTLISLAVCSALLLALPGHAQSIDPQTTGTIDPATQLPYTGAATQPVTTRGIFVATIVALIAQGLGSGIGSALSQGLGASITGWFNSPAKDKADKAAQSAKAEKSGKSAQISKSANASDVAKTSPASSREPALEPIVAPQAGVAFEVHLIGADGKARAVDPASHQFRTGDRFQVYYRPTLPGRVSVLNVDPTGKQARIDTVEVAAGQLAALGPYQFVDRKGDEKLSLVLEPCSTPMLVAATRGIIKVNAPAGAAAAPMQIADCGDPALLPATRGLQARPRNINVVATTGPTKFALDPMTKAEIKSGVVAPRVVTIALKHR